MDRSELPDTKAERVDWVIRAKSNQEMRRRYDIWADVYDEDVGSYDDYLAPREAVKVAKRILKSDALIFDAGAGTGLVGEALSSAGFENLIAVDYSAQMLDVARTKNIYSEIHECDLGERTDFSDDSMDAVITCGTTSQMPSYSLREFARIVRPNGAIIFCVHPEQWIECGYAEILEELEKNGKITLEERGPSIQIMPTTEPGLICEIWVMKVR